jgi:uncharacterized protein involved in response to NO
MALFTHGFRPFFLMSALMAPVAVGVWVLALSGLALPDGPLPPMRWHAHELLAGFVAAAMIGFLMSAIPNWVGRRGYSGAPLVALACVFLAARFAMLPGSPVPIGVAAVLALVPLPATLLLVLPALVKAKAPRLFGPPALVLVFWSGQLMMLAEEAGWSAAPGWATGQLLMGDAALLLVVLIGGRIVPSFTLNALRKTPQPAEARPFPGVDRGAILAVAAVALVDAVAPGSVAAGLVAALAAVLVALRLSRWNGSRTLRWPILWVLHLAYALIPLALAIKAASLLAGATWASAWLHLQLAGAVSLMIVAVMTRATLGHTGRALVVSPATVAAYVLLLAAALLRAFSGTVLAEDDRIGLVAAGLCWVGAFVLLLAVYAPMLLGPRADAAPG